ncbi:hypothetical protein [Campylobacter troglodytis]|uniref:hypothetical protein n=1 Tax=Campylobacter troglodytis TaxID=654363 RepID=UPI00115ABA19|nr:hypothetical protein DMC01_03885 [Campylobacter troglodytis]
MCSWQENTYVLFRAMHSFLCGAKAHYGVKHAKFEFAKGQNHINEIVNFFTSCFCSCVVEWDM